MGEIVPISLGQRSNPHRSSRQAGAARLINCFAESAGAEGKSPTTIVATPGLAAFGAPLSGG